MAGQTPETATNKARNASWAVRAAGWFVMAGVAVAFIGLAPSCSRVEGAGYQGLSRGAMEKFQVTADQRRMTPPTQLADAAGKPVTLADYRGQVVVANLWATWCAPCVEEMPTLAALSTAYKDRGVVVIPVSVDRDAGQSAKRLAELSGGALPFIHDAEFKFVYDVKAQGFPTTIIYDREGVEVGRLAGAADWASPEAKAIIDAALGE